MHSVESEMCHRTIKYTICRRRVRVHFSARKCLQAAAVKGLNRRALHQTKLRPLLHFSESTARTPGRREGEGEGEGVGVGGGREAKNCTQLLQLLSLIARLRLVPTSQLLTMVANCNDSRTRPGCCSVAAAVVSRHGREKIWRR